MNKYFKIITIFLLGALSGAGVTFLFVMSQSDKEKELWNTFFIASEMSEANRLYRESEPKIAIYALQRTLSSIESSPKSSLYNQERRVIWDTGLLNARIGRMYQKTSDEKLASEYFKNAMELFSKAGWILDSPQELNKAVDLIDNNRIEDALKNYGKLKSSSELKP